MMKSLDRNHFRPAHRHFIVSAPRFEMLTSQVSASGCPWLRDDAVFGIKEMLLADFETVDDPAHPNRRLDGSAAHGPSLQERLGGEMVTGALALCFASALAGAGLYLNFVEQPARLALDDSAILAEWAPSDRRGLALMATLALLAAIAGLVAFEGGGDLRYLGGALLALSTWPYSLFAMGPLNNQILALAPRDLGAARALVRQWGLLEYGQTALALVATGLFLGAI